MTDPVKPPPDPRYPRRQARARATRQRVLDAARALFIERGYVSTTIDAVAAAADVSPETVYSTFGNKRTLLARLIDVAIAGDVDAAPVLEQDWVGAIRAEADPRARLRILARHGREILERRAAVDDVVHGAAAADPDIAALRARGKTERRAGQRALLEMVLGPTGLRNGVDHATAADALYAIGSPEVYLLLVVDRGWSPAQFEAWYAETLERLLFE